MSTVGLTEQTLLENLSVYPNPVSDKLTVQFESKIPSFPTLVLTNTLGEVLLTVEKPGLIQQLDLSGLPKGLYFLKMNFSETQTTYKIVKE